MKKHKGARGHKRAPKQAAPVAPGPSEFDAGQEQAMRAGARQSRMADTGAPPMGGGGEPDMDDMGGM